MRRLVVLLLVVGAFVVLMAPLANANGNVAVCHIPPGNPSQAHTVVVGENAVDAHLEHHGDFLGGCPPS